MCKLVVKAVFERLLIRTSAIVTRTQCLFLDSISRGPSIPSVPHRQNAEGIAWFLGLYLVESPHWPSDMYHRIRPTVPQQVD